MAREYVSERFLGCARVYGHLLFYSGKVAAPGSQTGTTVVPSLVHALDFCQG